MNDSPRGPPKKVSFTTIFTVMNSKVGSNFKPYKRNQVSDTKKYRITRPRPRSGLSGIMLENLDEEIFALDY